MSAPERGWGGGRAGSGDALTMLTGREASSPARNSLGPGSSISGAHMRNRPRPIACPTDRGPQTGARALAAPILVTSTPAGRGASPPGSHGLPFTCRAACSNATRISYQPTFSLLPLRKNLPGLTKLAPSKKGGLFGEFLALRAGSLGLRTNHHEYARLHTI